MFTWLTSVCNIEKTCFKVSFFLVIDPFIAFTFHRKKKYHPDLLEFIVHNQEFLLPCLITNNQNV